MAITYSDYTGDGSNTDFAFSFPYLEDTHVVVEVDGVDKTTTAGDFTLPTTSLVRMAVAPALAADVRVKRVSDFATDLVDFTNGSVLTEGDLDRAYQHNRYLNEEAAEGNDASMQIVGGGTDYNAANKKIVNLADGTLATDAVNKGYVDGKVALTTTNLAGFYKSTHTGDGSVEFGLAFTPQTTDAKAYIVTIDGVFQIPDVAYTIGATSITFTSAPPTPSSICVLATAAASSTAVDNVLLTATGATEARSLADRAADSVNVMDFGAVGDGTTNDMDAFQAAIDAVGYGGGVVVAPANKRYFIDGTATNTNLTIKAGVQLTTNKKVPENDGPDSWRGLDVVNGALILNDASVGILMDHNSALVGFFVIRKEVVDLFKDASETGNENEYVTNAVANAWDGTAISLNNYANNVYVGHCNIIGFNIAITANAGLANGAAQFRAEYLNIDCKNGLVLDYSMDITYIENCHCWPITSVNSPGVDQQRNGTAFKISGTHDWTKFTNCFAYAYDRSFQVNGANHATFVGCGADYTPDVRTVGGTPAGDSVGFQVYQTGGSEATFINCQAAAQTYGMFLDSRTLDSDITLSGLTSGTYTEGDAVVQAVSGITGTVKTTVTGTSVVVSGTSGIFDTSNAVTIDGSAAGTPTGVSGGNTGEDTFLLEGCTFWATKTGGYAVKVARGSGVIDGCKFRGGTYAIYFGGPDWDGNAIGSSDLPTAANAGARWVISNNVFDGDNTSETGSVVLANLIHNGFNNKQLYKLTDNAYLNQPTLSKTPFDVTGTNGLVEITADSGTSAIYPPLDADVVKITSTTAFGTFHPTGYTAGRIVTLVAGAAFEIYDGSGSGYASGEMQLASGANFTMADGDTLTLLFNGVFWQETSRSDNT